VEQEHPGTTERLRKIAAWARRRSFAMFLSGLRLLPKPSASDSARSADGESGAAAAVAAAAQVSAGGGCVELTVRRLSQRSGRARGDVLARVLQQVHRHIASFL
jgi:hypothetical protein